MNELISTDKAELTILGTSTTDKATSSGGYLSHSPDSKDNTYYVIDVKVKNINDSSISVSPSGFTLLKDETRYSSSTLLLGDDSMSMETLNPGTEIIKKVYFDIPKKVAESNDLKVRVSSGVFSSTGKTVTVDLK